MKRLLRYAQEEAKSVVFLSLVFLLLLVLLLDGCALPLEAFEEIKLPDIRLTPADSIDVEPEPTQITLTLAEEYPI